MKSGLSRSDSLLFLDICSSIMAKQGKKDKQQKQLYKRLRNHYRLVILNDDTFEEKFSLRLTPLNVYTWGGSIFALLIVATISLIAFTPLREYIPGYADTAMKQRASRAAFVSDSLAVELAQRDAYLRNIQAILNGNPPIDSVDLEKDESIDYTDIQVRRSPEDSLFRARIEAQDEYNINIAENDQRNAEGYFFFTPVKGSVSSSFNPNKKHYGTDIVTSDNEAIKAVLEGTVIFAEWTSDNGHVIQVQHSQNLVSAYHHCSVLLKKVGQKVRPGEAIAIVGNSGHQTTGPHLHFELWENGTPLNPQQYIVF